jgi:hypothetical protein
MVFQRLSCILKKRFFIRPPGGGMLNFGFRVRTARCRGKAKAGSLSNPRTSAGKNLLSGREVDVQNKSKEQTAEKAPRPGRLDSYTDFLPTRYGDDP